MLSGAFDLCTQHNQTQHSTTRISRLVHTDSGMVANRTRAMARQPISGPHLDAESDPLCER